MPAFDSHLSVYPLSDDITFPSAMEPHSASAPPLASHPYLQASNVSSGKAHTQKDRLSLTKSSTADWDTTKPDVSFVSPTVASLAMRKFLSSSLANEGFLSAEPSAMLRLELEVTACAYL